MQEFFDGKFDQLQELFIEGLISASDYLIKIEKINQEVRKHGLNEFQINFSLPGEYDEIS